jgi:hypothetical protein
MKTVLSIREQILIRNEARFELWMFLSSIQSLPGETRDFADRKSSYSSGKMQIKTTVQAVKRSEVKTRKDIPSVIKATNPGPRPIPLSESELRRLKEHFLGLLRQSARHESPSKDQLGALIVALNRPVIQLTYAPNSSPSYSISSASSERHDAEHLLRYLNLIERCGPVHGLCGQCGAMFILGKGIRKFCAECSKQRQTYQGRKEYLKKKRKEYYWAGKAEDEPYKSKSKGKMHGKKKEQD